MLKRVALWASPEAMDIAGCGAVLVAQLVNKGLVFDAADFYRLKLTEIAALDGMTKEKAQQVFDAITASMKREGMAGAVWAGHSQHRRDGGANTLQTFCYAGRLVRHGA